MSGGPLSMIGAAIVSCAIAATAVAAQSAGQPNTATQDAAPKNIFHVKYVTEGTVYIDAGRNMGLQEGMSLTVVRMSSGGAVTEAIRFSELPAINHLRVASLADTSAVCDVLDANSAVQPGDVAYLSPESIEKRTEETNQEESKNYPVVVSFTDDEDPLDEEMRETKVPRIMEPSIDNQIRGRVGFDYSGISQPGGLSSNEFGALVEADMHRIGGTYWNFTGYWRGRFTSESSSSAAAPITLTDLINRTYHLGFTYDNPDSAMTVGIGRLYLPWAPSLNTIDGGYFGRRITRKLTTGFFGGSTPDPTSWSYAPNQRIAGIFVNYDIGNFDRLRWDTTAGFAITSFGWSLGREFGFFENTLSFGRQLSIYNSLQADVSRILPDGTTYNSGVSASFTTLRYQPLRRLVLSLNDNYFRNIPSFDPRLIGTGLLDQYLFQGLSGGFRLEVAWKITAYASLGRSSTSTDTSQSWNQLYGLTFDALGKTGLRLDAHYSKFSSSFGAGHYESVSLSRNMRENLRIELQGGWQFFNSPLTVNTDSKFVTGLVDWSVGPRYFMETGFTWNTGTAVNYQQWILTFGYRFGGFRPR